MGRGGRSELERKKLLRILIKIKRNREERTEKN